MSGTEVVKYEAAPLAAEYDAACRTIAECARVEDGKKLQDYAMAAATWARQANNTEALANWTKVTLRAQRKVGELLIKMKESGERRAEGQWGERNGTRRGIRNSRPSGGRQTVPTENILAPTLADLGITGKQSHVWQKLARLPFKQYEEKVAVATGRKVRSKPKVKTEAKQPPKQPKQPKQSKPTTSKKKERLDEYSAAESPAEVERKMFLHTAEDAAELAEIALNDLKKNLPDLSGTVREELDTAVDAVISAWGKIREHLNRGR